MDIREGVEQRAYFKIHDCMNIDELDGYGRKTYPVSNSIHTSKGCNKIHFSKCEVYSMDERYEGGTYTLVCRVFAEKPTVIGTLNMPNRGERSVTELDFDLALSQWKHLSESIAIPVFIGVIEPSPLLCDELNTPEPYMYASTKAEMHISYTPY